MSLGEKVFEETGKLEVPFIEEVDADGISMKQSFTSELKGVGRWPSGMNTGSGKIKIKPNGMARGKWHGMMMTSDGEMVVWSGSGRSKRAAKSIKGVMLITFMTMSPKLAWMNDVIVVLDISGDMMQFSSVAHEWK
jgi:hypothetical protein